MAPEQRRLRRTFSSASVNMAKKVLADRSSALKLSNGSPAQFSGGHSGKTFALPIVENAVGLRDAVMDMHIMNSLENRGVINWWPDEDCQLAKLHALDTDKDGNCLLHALSLGLVGCHDRDLTLRKALHSTLQECGHVFRQRWQLTQDERNKSLLDGCFVLEDEQWEREWQALMTRAQEGGRSLEDLHVLTLAHVLMRPIIIYAPRVLEDPHTGDAVAPVQMGGLYLPLEHPASQCIRDPLFVAYWNGHFVPLLTTDREPHASRRATQSPRSCDLVPIEWLDGSLFDVRFHLEQEDGPVEHCIRKFLDVSTLRFPQEPAGRTCLCVERRAVCTNDDVQKITSGLLSEISKDGCGVGGKGNLSSIWSPQSANATQAKGPHSNLALQPVSKMEKMPDLQVDRLDTRAKGTPIRGGGEEWERVGSGRRGCRSGEKGGTTKPICVDRNPKGAEDGWGVGKFWGRELSKEEEEARSLAECKRLRELELEEAAQEAAQRERREKAEQQRREEERREMERREEERRREEQRRQEEERREEKREREQKKQQEMRSEEERAQEQRYAREEERRRWEERRQEEESRREQERQEEVRSAARFTQVLRLEAEKEAIDEKRHMHERALTGQEQIVHNRSPEAEKLWRTPPAPQPDEQPWSQPQPQQQPLPLPLSQHQQHQQHQHHQHHQHQQAPKVDGQSDEQSIQQMSHVQLLFLQQQQQQELLRQRQQEQHEANGAAQRQYQEQQHQQHQLQNGLIWGSRAPQPPMHHGLDAQFPVSSHGACEPGHASTQMFHAVVSGMGNSLGEVQRQDSYHLHDPYREHGEQLPPWWPQSHLPFDERHYGLQHLQNLQMQSFEHNFRGHQQLLPQLPLPNFHHLNGMQPFPQGQSLPFFHDPTLEWNPDPDGRPPATVNPRVGQGYVELRASVGLDGREGEVNADSRRGDDSVQNQVASKVGEDEQTAAGTFTQEGTNASRRRERGPKRVGPRDGGPRQELPRYRAGPGRARQRSFPPEDEAQMSTDTKHNPMQQQGRECAEGGALNGSTGCSGHSNDSGQSAEVGSAAVRMHVDEVADGNAVVLSNGGRAKGGERGGRRRRMKEGDVQGRVDLEEAPRPDVPKQRPRPKHRPNGTPQPSTQL